MRQERSAPNTLLCGLAVLACLHAIGVLLLGIDKPLLDLHYFRQTQTALSAYWLMKGGPWFAYETPVVGSPWAIPFEFPLYQMFAAVLAKLGVPLTIAGRLVAFGFYLLALWPLRIIFDVARLSRAGYLAAAILFLTCPLYLYWSRTFLVESCALFFSLLWLALILKLTREPRLGIFAGTVLAGIAAVLAKSTTFPAFTAVGCLAIGLLVIARYLRGEPRNIQFKLSLAITAAVMLPYVFGFAWVGYSDRIKTANQFGIMLTSTALSDWNFGSFAQKLSPELWIATVRARVIPDTLGYGYIVALVTLGAALTSARTRTSAALALFGFGIPFLVFTNLHIVHNYYQNANALFLIAAVGIALGRIFDARQRWTMIALLTAIVAGQLMFFYQRFAPLITADYSENRLWIVSQVARENTGSQQSLLVIGDDWASTIPYHAERKALALPAWTPTALITRVLAEPQSFLGDSPLGGIVYCADRLGEYKASAPLIEEFVSHQTLVGDFGGCQFLKPGRYRA